MREYMRKLRGYSVKASKVGFLAFLSILALCVVNTQHVKSQYFETIFIESDGSVSSSTNVTVPIQRVGDLYTFNGSIVDYSIVILRDNIVVDGAGYILQGQQDRGIDLSYRSNVTIRNVQIWGLWCSIWLLNSFGNTITGNTLANNNWGIIIQNASNNNIVSGNNITSSLEGILLDGSSENKVSGNTITNNDRGISIYSSSNNILRNNTMNNRYNFAIYGTELSHFVNDVDDSNTINGKKVYWLVDESDMIINPSTFPDLGFLALVDCASITIQDLELTNNGQGVILAFTTNSIITQNYITNNSNGIGLFSSYSNSIYGNHITNNDRGILLSSSSKSNSVSTNNITNNKNGIYLVESSQNTISGNNITNSELGIGFRGSSSNMLYNNYFIGNTRQVYDSNMDNSSITPSVNFWDFGYPLGGNYWSDYAGLDVKTGSNQDQPGSDNIGDTPYIIYENNIDNYPLMPYGSPPAVSIVSPENETYNVNHVALNFTVSEPTSWMGYSLDGQANVTVYDNTTLSGLSDGSHWVIVYVNDTDGKIGTSETICFTIVQKSEPFPTTWIAAAIALIAVVGAALLLSLRKIKKTTGKVEK